MLQAKKLNEAIEIFKLNVEAYPKGFNTYDSLGEAYMTSGNTELAILNYKKSLELNPQNTGATAMLKRLENKSVASDPNAYDAYVGEYEVSPTFVVKVFKEGEKLMTQATGQPPSNSSRKARINSSCGRRCESHVHQGRQRSGHWSDHSPGWPRHAGKKIK